MKFGGTSVADAATIGRVAGIIGKYRTAGHELAVVVSAQRGVTDQLLDISGRLADGTDSSIIPPLIASLRERHMAALKGAAPELIPEVEKHISGDLETLAGILNAVHHLRELTPRSKDYIITFGERLNAPVVSAAFRHHGIPSEVLDGCEAGIITTAQHGEAMALPGCDAQIAARVKPLLSRSVPVIMGFMGCTEAGVVTTLGRSGSDYSGAIIGAGIDADEIWIWTDVDGIMTSDPRLIPDARVLPAVSYIEVMELSYFGAKVMHPRSIEPAMRKGILVRVKNTFNPDHPGTEITGTAHGDHRGVRAITYIDKVAAVSVNGAQMIGRPGVAKEIFSALAAREVNVMMISQASSEANISLIIDEAQLDSAMDALNGVVRMGIVREVVSNPDVCAVAVVGEGMAGAIGTGGRIFTAMGRGGINVMMISQGSSEHNISFVIRQKDGPRAVRIIHDEFRLSEAA